MDPVIMIRYNSVRVIIVIVHADGFRSEGYAEIKESSFVERGK
jgi:hypothetical protein